MAALRLNPDQTWELEIFPRHYGYLKLVGISQNTKYKYVFCVFMYCVIFMTLFYSDDKLWEQNCVFWICLGQEDAKWFSDHLVI